MTFLVAMFCMSFAYCFRMTTGLDKLVEAAASVDVLKKELELKEQEIKEATARAEEVLSYVNHYKKKDVITRFFILNKKTFNFIFK